MGTILYGNLRVEIVNDRGARLSLLSPREALPVPLPRPSSDHPSGILLLGRHEQVSVAYTAARAWRPLEFVAACGFGKTTLLRHIAAEAAHYGVARRAVYLHAGADGVEDVLQRLTAELYTSDPPVKPTPEFCTQLLRRAGAMIVLDDVTLDPGQVEYLLRVLAGGGGLVIASQRPILGRHGISRALTGLSDDAAVELVTAELGRPLTGEELVPVRRLIAAVDGQPLHLRQAAALIREQGMPPEQIARTAERDPEGLDRLSIHELAGPERRALAVLALAAGASMPADLVGVMGDIASSGESLGLLHQRGLAERHSDRFGLPVCKADGYRQLLLSELHLGAALRELVDWLAERDPTSADSLSAAGAALTVIEWAAERGDWPVVVELVRVAEPVLTLAGRWEASSHVLGRGLNAARATDDHAAEALFAHEQGALAFCRDELGAAKQLFEDALELRERIGDAVGAELTRMNLQLLQPPPEAPVSPAGHDGTQRRRLVYAVTAACTLIALAAGLVKAVTPGSSPTPVSATNTATASQPTSLIASGGTGPSSPSTAPTSAPTTSTGSPTTSTRGPTSPPPLQVLSVEAANFGPVDITKGQAPVSEVLLVSNPNSQPVAISGLQTSAPFTIVTDTCGGTVQSQGSCTLTVQFAPTALGVTNGTLTVDSAAGPSLAPLSGTGFVTLTIDIAPAVGTVMGDGFMCSQKAACLELITGSVTLTASPRRGFLDWTGACSGTIPTCALSTLTADTTVTAEFVQVT
jgi:Abnormal spindle-like microcephaly-assoc'd, ASPM-SPD-2-Hydin